MERTFEERLMEQSSLLNDYCELYDQGKRGHALSIAGRLDVILSMLRSQEGASFVTSRDLRLVSHAAPSTAVHMQNGYHPLAPVSVSARFGTGESWAEFIPLHRRPESIYVTKPMKIGAWTREVVLATRNRKYCVTRGVLITQMRNKDGGSHPYSEAEPAYRGVADKMGVGLYAFGPAGVIEYDPPAHIATMRHIAHEVLTSLEPHLPAA
jgi:hypothetical protein